MKIGGTVPVNNENKKLDFVLHCTHLFVSLQT